VETTTDKLKFIQTIFGLDRKGLVYMTKIGDSTIRRYLFGANDIPRDATFDRIELAIDYAYQAKETSSYCGSHFGDLIKRPLFRGKSLLDVMRNSNEAQDISAALRSIKSVYNKETNND